MARRKKPQITGSDPEYTSRTHQFTKLPTNKAADPVDQQAQEANPLENPIGSEPPKPEPRPKAKPAIPQSKVQAAPKKKANASRPASTKPPAAPKATTPAKRDVEGTRRVELLAALTPALHTKLQQLESHGIAYKDAMSVAGRRATKEFEASATYVEKVETERLPTAQAYRSSKSLPIRTLETLHDAANPLRLASDGAMVRGQFEPLFWQHLETVIEELNDRFAK